MKKILLFSVMMTFASVNAFAHPFWGGSTAGTCSPQPGFPGGGTVVNNSECADQDKGTNTVCCDYKRRLVQAPKGAKKE